ncbi:hypothetical protein [Bradyrhizobium forestalis]|uniref:hypothetical protein n=1 Tax=Bradyrhizobium forestalis TaxID=1419263 RepID=UPI001FE06D66|nr:hypothetical protein [Bradyrhizobium forestalis]
MLPLLLVLWIGELRRLLVERGHCPIHLLPHRNAIELALRIPAEQIAAQGRERGIEIADQLGARQRNWRAQVRHAIDRR